MNMNIFCKRSKEHNGVSRMHKGLEKEEEEEDDMRMGNPPPPLLLVLSLPSK